MKLSDIRDIVYVGATYLNFGHTAQYTMRATFGNVRRRFMYIVNKHDDDGESFSLHLEGAVEGEDLMDVLSARDIFELEGILAKEVKVGQYAEKLEKCDSETDLRNVEFEFLDDLSFPVSIAHRFWELFKSRRVALGFEEVAI